MKVLHVITGLGVGGAEHQLRLLLRHLPYSCEVVTLTNPGPVAASIRADGTPVHHLGMRGNRDVSAVFRLAALIRAGGFDLVHTHLYRACVYGRIAARLAGVPHVVATEHSLGDGAIEGRATTAAVRHLYLATERLGDATIAVSQTVAHRLSGWGVPASRVTVVPNGIDPTEFTFDATVRAETRARLGIPPAARVVGAVGRLEPTKRFDLLITALRDLDGVTLLLVGDGSARSALADQAARLGVHDRVVFAGETGHARQVLCAMDIFAAPSEQETFGLSVVEALACGLPAYYVACPALSELPPTAAPHAHRVPPQAPAFAAALRDEFASLQAWSAALSSAALSPARPSSAARSPAALSAAPLSAAALSPAPLSPAARLPVPVAVRSYDVARLAAAVAQCYQRVSAQPRHSRPLSRYHAAGSEGR